jgi:hypothetical protein
MNRLAVYIVFVATLLASGSAGVAATRVYAKVEAETSIFPGDTFRYSIVVEGGSRPTRIDISPLAPFNPRQAGTGTSMQQFNDRMTTEYSTNYAITAQEPGKMVLPPVTVVVGGKSYATNSVEVTVSSPGTTDRLTLEQSLSEQQCYVGQPVVVTVKWVVTARVQDASFNVPVFKSDAFYIEDVSEQEAAVATEKTTIHGVPITVRETRQLIKGMEAAVITFKKVLIPKQAGRFVFDPVSVSTNVAVGRVRTRDFFNPYRLKFERVAVQSEPVELLVRPLPDSGRPESFYGLVGRYTIAASATPTQVSVGDPITLTIKIGGNPYLTPVQWPALEQVPDLAKRFRIPAEKASPVIEAGQKVFTQTIRANSDEVTRVPPIPLAYFDPDRGDYVVAQTDPIPLEVAPTRILTNADVEGTGFDPVNREVEAVRKGLSANYYGPEVLRNQSFSLATAIASPGYAVLWSLPSAALIASVVVRFGRRTDPKALARKRRRRAARRAVQQFKSVAEAAPDERPELVLATLRQYVGDRFDRVAASLTAEECHQIVAAHTDDAEAPEQVRNTIARCEAARYAPLEAEIDETRIEEVVALIDRIETQVKK